MHSDDPGVSAGLMADAKADDDALVLTATQAETRVELEASRRQSDASHAPRQGGGGGDAGGGDEEEYEEAAPFNPAAISAVRRESG